MDVNGTKRSLAVLYISDGLLASSILGVVKPLLALQEQGEIVFRMKYASHYREEDVEWADVVVLCRSVSPKLLTVIELVQKHKKRLVYDIDDNFFELSIQNPLGRYHRFPPHLYVVREMIRCADAVRVYSRPMEEIAGAWNENTRRLKCYFDFSLIEGIAQRPHEKLRIVYASGRGNADPLAQICLPAVARVLTEYSDQVEFYLFGKAPAYMKHLKNIHELRYISDYSKFIRFFFQQAFDIGLAPLLDDRFHNSKTNNKFREYGAMGVCGVYSDAEIYRECVRDRENGMLVDNTADSWYGAVCALVEDAELRQYVRQNAKQDVQNDYSMENTLRDWREMLFLTRENEPAFKNYRQVRVSVLTDSGLQDKNYRLEQLLLLLGVTQVNYLLDAFQSADLKKMSKCDVCICFASSDRQAELWIATLKNFGFLNVVMDTLLPCKKCTRYPDILFTNPAQPAKNAFAIPDLYTLERPELASDILESLSVLGSDLPFAELYDERRAAIGKNEESVLSLHSPMVLWAELLSRYVSKEGQLQREGLLLRSIERLKPIFMRLACLLKKLWMLISKPFEKVHNAISRRLHNAFALFKVNVLKKY